MKEELTGSSETFPAIELPSESTLGASEGSQKVSGFSDEPLFSGEVKLVISPQYNIGTLLKLFNYLQTLPDIKLVYTTGARDTEVTIKIGIDKPTPIIWLISKVEGVTLATGPATNLIPEEKAGPLIEKKRNLIREIRLVCKE